MSFDLVAQDQPRAAIGVRGSVLLVHHRRHARWGGWRAVQVRVTASVRRALLSCPCSLISIQYRTRIRAHTTTYSYSHVQVHSQSSIVIVACQWNALLSCRAPILLLTFVRVYLSARRTSHPDNLSFFGRSSRHIDTLGLRIPRTYRSLVVRRFFLLSSLFSLISHPSPLIHSPTPFLVTSLLISLLVLVAHVHIYPLLPSSSLSHTQES